MMLNSNHQTKSIYTLSDVEDLSCDTAANTQGGAAMELYRHPNLKGDRLAAFDYGGDRLLSGNADNQATSVRIRAGRWTFYNLPNFFGFGGKVTLGPGVYNLHMNPRFDDQISSFRRVG